MPLKKRFQEFIVCMYLHWINVLGGSGILVHSSKLSFGKQLKWFEAWMDEFRFTPPRIHAQMALATLEITFHQTTPYHII